MFAIFFEGRVERTHAVWTGAFSPTENQSIDDNAPASWLCQVFMNERPPFCGSAPGWRPHRFQGDSAALPVQRNGGHSLLINFVFFYFTLSIHAPISESTQRYRQQNLHKNRKWVRSAHLTIISPFLIRPIHGPSPMHHIYRCLLPHHLTRQRTQRHFFRTRHDPAWPFGLIIL